MAKDRLPEVTGKPDIRMARRAAEVHGDTRTVEQVDRMYPDNTDRRYRISPPPGSTRPAKKRQGRTTSR